MQLADLLRVVFGVERPEHLEVMQWALHANGRATSELEARLRCVYDDFLEADAGREWKEAEESELRRLLDKQHSLPSFNAMLEIAVLEVRHLMPLHKWQVLLADPCATAWRLARGLQQRHFLLQGKDLKPKKQKAMCMSATADTGHMAVVQLKMPGGKSSDAPLPARTRTVGGWVCLCAVGHLPVRFHVARLLSTHVRQREKPCLEFQGEADAPQAAACKHQGHCGCEQQLRGQGQRDADTRRKHPYPVQCEHCTPSPSTAGSCGR